MRNYYRYTIAQTQAPKTKAPPTLVSNALPSPALLVAEGSTTEFAWEAVEGVLVVAVAVDVADTADAVLRDAVVDVGD